MTKKQVAFIVCVNAIISLLISLSVVLFVEPRLSRRTEGAVRIGRVTIQPTPTTASVVYIVQEGDSLYKIAQEYGVSVEDIMRANAIINPDLLFVGQELIIPLQGLPPPTPLTKFTYSLEGIVEIREVIARGDYPNEALILLNTGQPVHLRGWTLSDQDGHVYTFPDLFLGSGGSVRIHTARGRDTVHDLYWGLDTAVWERGDVATLRDKAGKVVATYTVP